ncbi:Protein artichoke [Gryllus bimaculatus]|nr:Protein artichoke [Gryllus bimaculatus]
MYILPTIWTIALTILSVCDIHETSAKDDPRCPSVCKCYPWPPRVHPAKMAANCSGRALKALPAHFQRHFASLDASFNDIEELSNDFFGDAKMVLSKINLSNNSIHTIDSRAFSMLPDLWIMNLTGNKIRHLHQDTFKVNTKLWYLILRGNTINFNQSTFLNAPQIGKLDLSYNNLHELGDNTFNEMPNIVYLRLHNNQFKKLQSSWFRPLRKLERLFLEHNQLTVLDVNTFIHSPKLFELSLSWNKLLLPYHTPFLRLPNLEYLHLSGCGFGNIPSHIFEFTPRVRMLWLSSNRLSALPLDIFNYLESLIFLDACDNNLLCSCELKEVWDLCRYRHIAADVSCDVHLLDGTGEGEGEGEAQNQTATAAGAGGCFGRWDALEEMVCNATDRPSLPAPSKDTSVEQLALYVSIGVVLLLSLCIVGSVTLYCRKYKSGWTSTVRGAHNLTYPDMMPLNIDREEAT